MAKPRHRALVIGLVSVLAGGSVLAPVSASASVASTAAAATVTAADDDAVAIDRAAEYEELSADQLAALGLDAAAQGETLSLLATERLSPVYLTDEMKYFTIYESNGNYDQGLSYGDGYNALGYYQFDRRYALVPFITAVYNYNPQKYAMFEAVIAQSDTIINGAPDPENPDKRVNPFYDSQSKALTDLGNLVNDAWHAAYKADPSEFSALQDSYSYQSYYKQAERIFSANYGITLDGRADAVRGLAWGMCNLFGSGGMQKFIKAASLNDKMTDRQIATRLTNAIVDYYSTGDGKGHTYAAGYINRYKKEQGVVLKYVQEDEWNYLRSHYTDVTSGYWAMSTLAWASQRGFVTGYGGTSLMAPEESVSRAQVATVLSRLGGGSAGSVGSLTFTDVDHGEWYAKPIAWAVKNGVAKGVGNNKFEPETDVLREQVAIFLMNYANMRGFDTSARTNLLSYADGAPVDEWAYSAMSWAVATGIIEGSNGYLNPAEGATRAEFATMLIRFCDRYAI